MKFYSIKIFFLKNFSSSLHNFRNSLHQVARRSKISDFEKSKPTSTCPIEFLIFRKAIYESSSPILLAKTALILLEKLNSALGLVLEMISMTETNTKNLSFIDFPEKPNKDMIENVKMIFSSAGLMFRDDSYEVLVEYLIEFEKSDFTNFVRISKIFPPKMSDRKLISKLIIQRLQEKVEKMEQTGEKETMKNVFWNQEIVENLEEMMKKEQAIILNQARS